MAPKETSSKKSKAWEHANTRKGYWRISNSPILATALINDKLENLVRTYRGTYSKRVNHYLEFSSELASVGPLNIQNFFRLNESRIGEQIVTQVL